MKRVFFAIALLALPAVAQQSETTDVLTGVQQPPARPWQNPDAAKPAIPEDAAALTDAAWAYLTGLDTLQAQFLQIGQDGTIQQGTLSLDRPGRLRFEYEPPSPLLIVADRGNMAMIDNELGQLTRWPLNDTPLKVIAGRDPKRGKDIQFTEVLALNNLVRFTVIDPDRPNEGEIRLLFTRDPFELRQWEVVDARGYSTKTILSEVVFDVELDDKLFTYEDPRPGAKRRGPRK